MRVVVCVLEALVIGWQVNSVVLKVSFCFMLSCFDLLLWL